MDNKYNWVFFISISIGSLFSSHLATDSFCETAGKYLDQEGIIYLKQTCRLLNPKYIVRHFRNRNKPITDDRLELIIKANPNLLSFHFSSQNNVVTDSGIENFRRLTQLQCIHFSGLPNISGEWLRILSSLNYLRSIGFSSCTITADVLEGLTTCTGLKNLTFRCFCEEHSLCLFKLAEGDTKIISKFNKLQRAIFDCKLPGKENAILQALAACPQIEYIYIRGPVCFSPETIQMLVNCATLVGFTNAIYMDEVYQFYGRTFIEEEKRIENEIRSSFFQKHNKTLKVFVNSANTLQ